MRHNAAKTSNLVSASERPSHCHYRLVAQSQNRMSVLQCVPHFLQDFSRLQFMRKASIVLSQQISCDQAELLKDTKAEEALMMNASGDS